MTARALPLSAVTFLMLVVGTIPASAGAYGIADMLEQAQRWQAQAQSAPKPEWLKPGGAVLTPTERAQIESVSNEARRLQAQRLTEHLETASRLADNTKATPRRVEFLVSWSLGEATLREIVHEAAADPASVVVFRGLPEGNNTAAGIAKIQALVAGIDPPPNVVLDPTRFRRLHTDLVPTLSFYDGDRLLITARGTTSIRYLTARLKGGASGDLGAVGPAVTATEPDLIAVMQRRLAALDLRRAAEGTRERYWRRLASFDLPQAAEPRTRHIDPTVVVVADIKDAGGAVIVPVGRHINPLEVMPFTQRLIIFDAARPAQVRLVEGLEQQYRDRRVTLIAARLDREAGWDGFNKLQNALRGPVFVLTDEIKERFQIERLPTVVEAAGREFLVQEIPPPAAHAEARR